MKTIKEYLSEGLIKRHAGVDMRAKIEAWLDGHKIKNYIINDNFTIDVHQTVWLPVVDEIPQYIQFGKVYGDFNMTHCGVKTLRGCPYYCQTFNCRFCDEITNLIGAPERVSYGFNCGYCKNLVSLEGMPDTINGDFDYSFCQKLTDLSYHPKKVSGKLYCYGLNLSKDEIQGICKVHRARIKNKITTT